MKSILKKIIVLTALAPFTFLSFGQAIQVDCDDNVGIGIDPTEKLHINGSIRGNQAEGALKIQTDAGYIAIGPQNSSWAHLITDLNEFYIHKPIQVDYGKIGSYNEDLHLRTGFTTRMTIKISNGRVGIADIDPDYMLDVNGDIGCVQLHQSSDERLKKDIVDLDEQKINNLYNLQAKSYIRDNSLLETENGITSTVSDTAAAEDFGTIEIDTTHKIGFIAQQLQEYFPNLVDQDNEGFYSINYIALIPVLVEAVKDHQERIINLEEKLEQLKSSNSSLKSESININNTESPLDNSCTLYQNTPNPFNEDTEIKLNISENAITSTLIVYDMQGTQLRSYNIQERGLSSVIIYGYELDPGMYLYSLITDGKEVGTKRMILTN